MARERVRRSLIRRKATPTPAGRSSRRAAAPGPDADPLDPPSSPWLSALEDEAVTESAGGPSADTLEFQTVGEVEDDPTDVQPLPTPASSQTPAPPQGFTVAFPEPGPPPGVPPAAWVALGARMALAFAAAATVTAALLLVPWIWLISPGLDGARQAYHASLVPDAEVVEVQVEVPVPVPVPVPSDPVVETKPSRVVAARVTPKPRPSETFVPTKTSTQTAEPTPPPPPEPVVPEPKKVAPAPAPAPVDEAPPPPPETPAAARQLEGSMTGSSGGRSLAMNLDFRPGGRLAAKITRAGGKTVDAFGTYSLKDNRSAITLVEPGKSGATYTGTVNGSGASGHIHYSDGKTRRFKVKR